LSGYGRMMRHRRRQLPKKQSAKELTDPGNHHERMDRPPDRLPGSMRKAEALTAA